MNDIDADLFDGEDDDISAHDVTLAAGDDMSQPERLALIRMEKRLDSLQSRDYSMPANVALIITIFASLPVIAYTAIRAFDMAFGPDADTESGRLGLLLTLSLLPQVTMVVVFCRVLAQPRLHHEIRALRDAIRHLAEYVRRKS